MSGRHFSSPILVNHWQTSSVFSSLRDLATCLATSWGEGAVTYLLLIPHSAWAWNKCHRGNGFSKDHSTLKYVLPFYNVVWLHIVCLCLLKVWEWQMEHRHNAQRWLRLNCLVKKLKLVGGKTSRQNMIKLQGNSSSSVSLIPSNKVWLRWISMLWHITANKLICVFNSKQMFKKDKEMFT